MAETLSFPFPSDVKKMLSFIGTRKRKVNVYRREAGNPETLYSYWDSGSRASYTAFDKDGHLVHVPVNGHPMFDASGRNPKDWVPKAGDILVRHGVTNGKPATPSITYYE